MSAPNSEPEQDRESSPVPNRSRMPRKKRISRYQKSLDRRARQRRGDTRFYNIMFSIIALTTLIALMVAASALKSSGVEVGFLANLTAPWIGKFSKLEILGIAFIGLIAVISYLRMRRAK